MDDSETAIPSKAPIEWIDSLDVLKAIAEKSLSYEKPMVSHSTFSLYDAMSAIEVSLTFHLITNLESFNNL